MAQIKPFRGYRFTISSPQDLGPLCAPPYDMLDDAAVDRLYAMHPNNIVRITQNKREPADTVNKDRHVRAAGFLSRWIDQKIIARDDADSIYIYRQQFKIIQNGKPVEYERTGVCALVELTDFEEQVVLPHEYTLSGPKQDRYELMETTLANTGQIFGLAADDGGELYTLIRQITGDTPMIGTFTDENGVTHSLHRCADAGMIAKAAELMSSRNILIADGHHRYETALRFYKDRGRDEKFSHVMMTLVSTADPGLVIRPFHRLVRKSTQGRQAGDMKSELAKYFDVSPIGKATAQRTGDALGGTTDIIFWDCKTGELYTLTLNKNGEDFLENTMPERSKQWKRLDVSKINCIIINGILELPLDGQVLHDIVNYVNDADDGAKRLTEERDGYYGGFFINPVTITTINDTVKSGERMPQKSTNFFPKVWAGLAINKMDVLT
ncbi:MAG: DUF1015 domain-containing protein [Chitinispirillales bacterium]|jgi:uncharacterized protein (DUF1015 family)|nr:DUF1015 domain-containing protein [Chitinispirillales bacterium]